MMQFDAQAVCENAIFGRKWFARIRQEQRMVALCCPLCTETIECDGRQHEKTAASTS